MKFAVFITSGIGNAIFLIPLIKVLKGKGKVYAIATSTFHAERLFDGYCEQLFEKVIVLDRSINLWRIIPSIFLQFDTAYVDYFGANRRNLWIAHIIARETITNRIPRSLPAWVRNRIKLIPPIKNRHESTQYLRFTDTSITKDELSQEMFFLTAKKTELPLPERYITVQPGAGNNLTPWKLWPLDRWTTLIETILEHNSDLSVIVLGDRHDRSMGTAMEALHPSIITLVDKTPLHLLPGIVTKSVLHIGGDSGILHVAGTVGTPTITIVGGSDPALFGWHRVDDKKHLIVQHLLACHPCYRWYLPNRTRVKEAIQCPDFACIRSIDPTEVNPLVERQLKASRVS